LPVQLPGVLQFGELCTYVRKSSVDGLGDVLSAFSGTLGDVLDDVLAELFRVAVLDDLQTQGAVLVPHLAEPERLGALSLAVFGDDFGHAVRLGRERDLSLNPPRNYVTEGD